jgi:hypothetical protein
MFTCGFALAGCGGGNHPADTSTPRSAPPLEISITGTARSIVLGQPLTIDGQARRGGHFAARVKLELHKKTDGASGSGAVVATTTTTRTGRYRFVQTPDRNAVWTVEAAGAGAGRSGRLPVAVKLVSKLRPRVIGGQRYFVFTAYGPPDAKPRHARALMYVVRRGQHRARRIGSAPLMPTRSRRTVATARFAPPTGRGLIAVVCVPGNVAKGWGVGKRHPADCGAPHIAYKPGDG